MYKSIIKKKNHDKIILLAVGFGWHKVLTRFRDIKIVLPNICHHHHWWQRKSLIPWCYKAVNFWAFFAWKDWKTISFKFYVTTCILQLLNMGREITTPDNSLCYLILPVLAPVLFCIKSELVLYYQKVFAN